MAARVLPAEPPPNELVPNQRCDVRRVAMAGADVRRPDDDLFGVEPLEVLGVLADGEVLAERPVCLEHLPPV